MKVVLDEENPPQAEHRDNYDTSISQQLKNELILTFERPQRPIISLMLASESDVVSTFRPTVLLRCQQGNIRTIKDHFRARTDNNARHWLLQAVIDYCLVLYITQGEFTAATRALMGVPSESNSGGTIATIDLSASTRTLCGLPVYDTARHSHDDAISIFGGTIYLGGSIYGLLALHPFSRELFTRDEPETDNHARRKTSDTLGSERSLVFNLSTEEHNKTSAKARNPDRSTTYTTLAAGEAQKVDTTATSIDLASAQVGAPTRVLLPTLDVTYLERQYKSSQRFCMSDWTLCKLTQLPREVFERVAINKVGDLNVTQLMEDLGNTTHAVTIVKSKGGLQAGTLQQTTVSFPLGDSYLDVYNIKTDRQIRKRCFPWIF